MPAPKDQKNSIPCSVSLLTLNAAEGLQKCLEILKDFEEVIVCDGNSTDTTLQIAQDFGARIIKQYDTDEPNVSCAMDKAAVRERAMSASTLPWRFFMDADDLLSPETIEEIRKITKSKTPEHLVWRMPSRVHMGDTEIIHYASYPAYQTRLVHQSVEAHFKGEVHDHLVFDGKKFSVGTMQSSYTFLWPEERVTRYWHYMKAYAERELLILSFDSFSNFLRWGIYFRLRIIFGYLLWRLPFMYLRHGFKDSMPLSLELTIVRYHIAMLFGAIRKYFATRTWVVLLIETLRGKDLNRIFSNIAVREYEAYGRVLDVGGDESSSYWRYLKMRRWYRKIIVNLEHEKADIVVDMEKGSIPLQDGYCDSVLMFNVLEHLDNREGALREVRRVLRPGGNLVGVIPFLVGVHPDPHDFVRFTAEGLHALLSKAGFADITIQPVARGPLSASYYQSEFLLPRILKLLALPLVLTLDRIALYFRPEWKHKFPLSYVFCAR